MAINQIPETFRTKFVDVFKMDFDREQAILAPTTNKDGIVGAETIKWDVVDPSDEAVTKTRDGKVPTSQLGLSQVSATLEKIHKKFKRDNFDAFMANPNLWSAFNRKGIASINKGIDQKIINLLDATTVELNSGNAVSFQSLATFQLWTNTLWENDVPSDGRVWGVVTPAAATQMLKINSFASADFVDQKVMADGVKTQGYRYWMGVKWLMHTGLTGMGGATAECYIYHQDALCHMLSGDPSPVPFTNDEDDYAGIRYEAMHAGVVGLPRGIVRAVSDDNATFA